MKSFGIKGVFMATVLAMSALLAYPALSTTGASTGAAVSLDTGHGLDLALIDGLTVAAFAHERLTADTPTPLTTLTPSSYVSSPAFAELPRAGRSTVRAPSGAVPYSLGESTDSGIVRST